VDKLAVWLLSSPCSGQRLGLWRGLQAISRAETKGADNAKTFLRACSQLHISSNNPQIQFTIQCDSTIEASQTVDSGTISTLVYVPCLSLYGLSWQMRTSPGPNQRCVTTNTRQSHSATADGFGNRVSFQQIVKSRVHCDSRISTTGLNGTLANNTRCYQ
jgi:hypothetical protein